jgi:hypothetical protein
MSETTPTGNLGATTSNRTTDTTAPTDAEAHGGPTMSEMAAGGTGSSGASTSTSTSSTRGTSSKESPAGPGATGDEWREPVDSVGAAQGLPGRVLGMLRDRPVVAGAILAAVAAVAVVVVRMLRRT